MAEEHDNSQFGKGIALNCGFDLGAQHLLDSRCAVADWNELYSIPAIRRADGLVVWVRSEKRLVVWDAEAKQWVNLSTLQDIWEHEEWTERYEWYNIREYSESQKERNVPLLLPYAIGGLAERTAMTDFSGGHTSELLRKLLFPYVPPYIAWNNIMILVRTYTKGVSVVAHINGGTYSDGDINFAPEQSLTYCLDGYAYKSVPCEFPYITNSIGATISRNEDGTLTVSLLTGMTATEEAKAHIANFRLDCPHRLGVRLRYETLKNKFHKAYAASGKEVLVEQTHYVAPNYLVATFTMEELEAAAPDVCAAIKAGDAAEVEVSAANLEALGVTPDMFSNSTYAKNDNGTLSDADGKVLMLASTLPAHTLTVGNTRFGSKTDNKGVTATFSFGEDSGVFGPYLNLKCHLLFLTVPDGATTWEWRQSGYDPTEYEYVEQEGESGNGQ